MLNTQLERVRQRIHQACQRSGRPPEAVTLVCVTKGVAIETIREAVAVGVSDLGENRVQDAATKMSQLASSSVRWHLIGHLQRNKAKDAAALFGLIHSVDSLALAEALERHAVNRGAGHSLLGVLLQVNVSGEATKFGCAPDEVPALARALRGLSHLRWEGLMTIAPFVEDPHAARPVFRRLRELRDALAADFSLPASSLKLSMGMSQDFEVAIEEGADLVRIGTAIFQGA